MICPGNHAATAVQDGPGKTYLAQECNDPVSLSDVRDHDLESDSYPLGTAVQML